MPWSCLMTRDRFQNASSSLSPTGAAPRPSWPVGLAGLAYGGDYNPEQGTRDAGVGDERLQRGAGVNRVRLGMVSRGNLEPRRGEFHWGGLDEVFALLHEAGIRIDLGTPTAAP